MTVQCPPAFRLSYVAIVHASSCRAIFLSFFSAMLSFMFLVSFCTSFFSHLAVCNTAELVLCWCVLTTCISGSSFLSTYSINFVFSTAWAASNCIKPLPTFIIIIIIIIIIIFHIYGKSDESNVITFRVTSLLYPTFKIVSNILQSYFIPFAGEIT